ncbi:porin [Janthinobacterium sp. 17J80-10]|uniref:porin n=1 Tax=Janthinobacterium sp. 17J80-10 TaxID=2497863 RepID=UPI0013E8C070|nr:porin [Janthinobacterium sp. 17J80-10]
MQYDRTSLLQVGRVADRTGGADRTRTAWEVPVSYTFGKNTVLAHYTRAGNISNTPGRTGAKLVSLGYDYSLSRRTNVGVFYSQLKNDAQGVYNPFNAGTSMTGSTVVAGESVTTMALGIKHVF